MRFLEKSKSDDSDRTGLRSGGRVERKKSMLELITKDRGRKFDEKVPKMREAIQAIQGYSEYNSELIEKYKFIDRQIEKYGSFLGTKPDGFDETRENCKRSWIATESIMIDYHFSQNATAGVRGEVKIEDVHKTQTDFLTAAQGFANVFNEMLPSQEPTGSSSQS